MDEFKPRAFATSWRCSEKTLLPALEHFDESSRRACVLSRQKSCDAEPVVTMHARIAYDLADGGFRRTFEFLVQPSLYFVRFSCGENPGMEMRVIRVGNQQSIGADAPIVACPTLQVQAEHVMIVGSKFPSQTVVRPSASSLTPSHGVLSATRSAIDAGTCPRLSIRLNTSYTSVFDPALRRVSSSLNQTYTISLIGFEANRKNSR